MTIVKIPDELYLHSIKKTISTANMKDMVEYALITALNARFRKCKTVGAQVRLFETLEQGNWWAKRATFQEKINEMKMHDLVGMLSVEQKQALIDAIWEHVS